MSGADDPAIESRRFVDPQGSADHWRVIGACVAGSSHEKEGLPCQDAVKWAIPESNVLVAAVADGAGSARFGEIGSKIAVENAMEYVTTENRLPAPSEDDLVWHSFLTAILQSIRTAIAREAEGRRTNLSDLATTVIVTIATPEIVSVAQIGDGAAIVMDREGGISAITIPQIGEYINETNFITMPDALYKAQVLVHRGCITHLALMSDGLQMLALEMPDFVPYTNFFLPLFRFVSGPNDDADAQSQMFALLRSSRVRERTDDDLTLLVAGFVENNASVP